MNSTKQKFFDLFEDIDGNAEKIIDTQLECLELRMKKLEKRDRWRDILAIVQEYKEWGLAKENDDYDMMWMNRISDLIDSDDM